MSLIKMTLLPSLICCPPPPTPATIRHPPPPPKSDRFINNQSLTSLCQIQLPWLLVQLNPCHSLRIIPYYLGFNAKENLQKLRNGRSFVMIAYYVLLWLSVLLNFGWCSVQVVEWRLEKLVKECERNPDSYSDVIHLCGKIQNLQYALRVFTLMENHNIKPTSSVFNALISASMSSGNVITSISLFETMQTSEDYNPNSDTYTAFILGFGDLGNEKSMISWYKAKLASGFSADIQTYEALIKGFIRSKNVGDASKFFNEMIALGIVPNASILQIMIMGFIELGGLNKVKDFMMLIQENGWQINVDMARTLAGFYCELGTIEEMEELLEMVTKMSKDLDVLSHFHNGLIKMYARLDRLDDVEYFVGRMLRQGMVFRCADDVDKVISSYFRRAAHDRLEIFLECIKDSYTLRRSTYDLLIAGFRRAGLYENMEMVVKDMKVAGVS